MKSQSVQNHNNWGGRSSTPPDMVCCRCKKADTLLIDSPADGDQRAYCVDCYAHLFPPGWTDEYQPLVDPDHADDKGH